MKKIIPILLVTVLLFVSCGAEKNVSIKETIEMPWGSFDLLTGWKYEKINDGTIKLINIDEEHLFVTFKPVPTPTNFETWITNQAVLTGRNPVKAGTAEINGEKVDTFTTSAKIGKIKVDETLYLIPLTDNSLSIVTAKPVESDMGFHLKQVLKSVEVKR